jgi:hypothetical protein
LNQEKGNKTEKEYSDFAVVETMHNYVLPEDLPEGPYGSPRNDKLGKSTPFDDDQRYYSAFNYENKTLHEGLPRQDPGAHPIHDDPNKNEEAPYDDVSPK